MFLKFRSLWVLSLVAASCMMAACTSTVSSDSSDDDEDFCSSSRERSSSSVARSSSSLIASSDSYSSSSDTTITTDPFAKLDSLIPMVKIPKTDLKRSTVVMSVDPFLISKTEVTQGLYKTVMGEVPEMDKSGDNVAVGNVNWYDAVLFCNALSKFVGLDTAYVYEKIGLSNYLENVTIDYGVKAVRLPSETEWEIACRAGTTTTYYWDTAPASKYAYYIQNNGPSEVGKFLPNGYGLYDMGGNVSEWVNDWYDAYPVKSTENYRGPQKGDYRVIRGGGWTDKAPALASASREKKDPLYQSDKLGFRISVVQ